MKEEIFVEKDAEYFDIACKRINAEKGDKKCLINVKSVRS
jgi:hypothetical protein